MKKALLYTNFFYVVWPEIALRLLEIQEFDSSWASEEIMDLLVRIIRRPECYNALLPSEKLQILSHFIQSSYELDILHDEVGKIGTRHQELQKEKTALQEDIKSDEIHLVELKSQLSNQETLVKKKESAFEEYKETAPNGADTTMSKLRSDTNKKQKEIDDAKRERQRIEYSIEKLEIQVDKKKAQYKKVSKEMLSIMHTSQYIGSESKGNSYWLFIFDAGRVYAHSALEDKWGFYETQAEIEELLKALDTRGIMEQKLWEKIKWFLASDLISLPQTKKDEQIKKNEEKGAGENEKMELESGKQEGKTENPKIKEETKMILEKEGNRSEITEKNNGEASREFPMQIEGKDEDLKKPEYQDRIKSLLEFKIKREPIEGLMVFSPEESIRKKIKLIREMIYESPFSSFFLGVEWLRQFISVFEALYSEYLFSRNMRWTRTREEFLLKLEEAETVEEFQGLIESIGNGFCVIEKLEEMAFDLSEDQQKKGNQQAASDNDEESETLKPRRSRYMQLNLEEPEVEQKEPNQSKDPLKFDDTKFYTKKVALKVFTSSYEKEFWSGYIQQEGDRLLPLLLGLCLFVDVIMDYLVRKMALKPSSGIDELLVELKYTKKEKPQPAPQPQAPPKTQPESKNSPDLSAWTERRVLRSSKGPANNKTRSGLSLEKEEEQSSFIDDEKEPSEEEEPVVHRKQNRAKSEKKEPRKSGPMDYGDFLPLKQTRSVSRKINNHIFS